ncbi:gpi ethanolamine phosphate transferase 1 [Diplodia corticola]|uniref:GPI ethanolamine phosphate transferase 1 n=1 Tax=Diplodia corticola TaxID=236234 RepID=A0A1J9R8F3_9PEZI|nr:gpi ethanolamine phosphate transferase 1 [Diplodia corticola]OJD28675.1 gpi ethanolamine phosphate transferase 1 [Diplodia corticola]
MARLGRAGFLAVAVVFHLVYIYSIFDIYFISPIVSGMREYRLEAREAPAKRLVLFVGDGLRADKAFQYFKDPSPANPNAPEAQELRPLAPFLRSRVLSHGTFGVSHTRVPTESRPGHVALIAGLYEDVSAVTTGWKLNPVNFDSVFNRSRHTWSWGSPDILPMFEQGAVPGRVDTDMYGAEAEDFTSDATLLDTWVFDRVKALFRDAKTNKTLAAELKQEQNVFFLHLLGLDTTGHGYRPYSKEYLHNIKVVDQGVKEITQLIEDFYGDGKTAFVFTADHGMSDWGSHGDGHPDNTRTPLIAWGSGVAPPVKVADGIAAGHEDGFSSDWNLDQIQRNDVAQADVATLMAYLVGIAFPVNSVGELPLAYIKADATTKAEALLVNAKEILEMYHVKEEQKKSTELRYRPFPAFRDSDEKSVASRMARIRELIDGGHAEDAIQQCAELIKLGLEAIRYLQTYDWLFLRALVTLGYLGWIAFAITTVIDLHVLHSTTETSRSTVSTVVFSSVGVALFSVLIAQKSALTYYAYAFFPVMFWEEVYARRAALKKGKDVLFEHIRTPKDKIGLVVKFVASFGLLEAIVQSYFHREVFTICYLLATIWPVFYGMHFIRQNFLVVATWWLSCSMMSVFTLLDAVKVEDINLILIGGVLMFTVGALYLFFEKSIIAQSTATKGLASEKADGLSRTILGTQVGLIALAMLVTKSSVASLQAKEGLPLGTQVVGWVVLVASLMVPFLHGLAPNNHYIHRLVVIFLSFSPIFIILTISYEGLFYFAFCMTLVTWVRLEHRISQHAGLATGDKVPAPSKQRPQQPASSATKEPSPLKPAPGAAQTLPTDVSSGNYRSLALSDVRIALFFLFLLQSAFFSTGNIASISSFSLDAVSRLIPVFDPFSQGALLLFKILVPFAALSANLGILNRRLGVAPSALFMVVMAVGDAMTVSFFWMVRDEGSWLDIGTSISHFCIASGLCVFVAALEGVSEVLVSGVEFDGVGDARRLAVEARDKVVGAANGVAGKVGGENNSSNGGVVETAAAVNGGA